MSNGIPDVVRTRIMLHEAESAHRAAKLDAQLRGRVIGHAMSRRLREARDQAQQEAEAWAVLLDHVDRPVGQVVGVVDGPKPPSPLPCPAVSPSGLDCELLAGPGHAHQNGNLYWTDEDQ